MTYLNTSAKCTHKVVSGSLPRYDAGLRSTTIRASLLTYGKMGFSSCGLLLGALWIKLQQKCERNYSFKGTVGPTPALPCFLHCTHSSRSARLTYISTTLILYQYRHFLQSPPSAESTCTGAELCRSSAQRSSLLKSSV